MTPVDQTTFGFPGGNCFSACVASLLGLRIEEVPYFMGDGTGGGEWFDDFAAWLATHGFYPVNFRSKLDQWAPQGFYILNAGSPRGTFAHSVVARGKEIVHDPHPSRAGLVRLDETEVTLLIPFFPAGCRRCGGDKKIRCVDAECAVCASDHYCEASTPCPNGCAALPFTRKDGGTKR